MFVAFVVIFPYLLILFVGSTQAYSKRWKLWYFEKFWQRKILNPTVTIWHGPITIWGGVLYKEMHHADASKEAHAQALTLRKSLMQKDPEHYTFHVSCSMHNLGELYSTLNEEKRAEAYFQRSLEIRRRLARKNPRSICRRWHGH